MDTCNIIAEVTVKGIVFLGEAPTTGTYICAGTTLNPYTTAISPYVCSGIMSATAFGAVLSKSESAQGILTTAIASGCGVAVNIADDSITIIAVKIKEVHEDTKRSISETKRTWSALNTAEGITWLMNYLSGY
ncbi:MAG: hypothetical protein ACI9RU_001852 [Litorivivens sp.]|jgi:hypothetical protein